jgi:hypothetical protein
VDRFAQWLASGGSLRLVSMADGEATVDLCACTGEIMERAATRDPEWLRRLATDLDAGDSLPAQ